MRTVAEMQRRLLQKGAVDGEAEDMLALIVFCLRQIAATVREAAGVWDERGYWKKAADFETEWEWAPETAVRLEAVLTGRAWEQLPEILVILAAKTAGIEVNQFTRKESLWRGCRSRLEG